MAETRDDLIKAYFDVGFRDNQIRTLLHREHSIISRRQILRVRNLRGLSNRNYSESAAVVNFIMDELGRSGQLCGYRIMHAKCRVEGLNVRMEDVRLLQRQLDPVGVEERLRRRLSGRAYFAEGPNYIWHIDGYDKLKQFGLPIHGCIDGFSRQVIWLNVSVTNNNSKVIGGYFIEAVERLKGCPRIIRADYGTENGCVRDFQIFLRRDGHDPQRERCYIEGSSIANQRMEAWWGFLRKECVQLWQEHFKALRDRGDFGGDALDKGIVQFCFTSLLQDELDKLTDVWNSHPIRPTRNPRVPNGRPVQMFHVPGFWGARDHLLRVTDDDVANCKSHCEFRSIIPCDVDLFDACINIIRRRGLQVPTSMTDATDLYLLLRAELRQ